MLHIRLQCRPFQRASVANDNSSSERSKIILSVDTKSWSEGDAAWLLVLVDLSLRTLTTASYVLVKFKTSQRNCNVSYQS